MPGEVIETDCTPDPIHVPPHVGHDSGPGGREPPLPHCSKRGILVIWRDLNGTQQDTEMCDRGLERQLKQLWEEEARLSMAVEFEDYGRPLEMVKVLK